MSDETPLSERILDAAELVLRRHGAEKTNVVDIARLLEMSHGNIYRHYPSKKAILDAVAARWLHTITIPLEVIANDHGRPAGKRLEAWFHTLREAKRHKVLDDPELFRVYHSVAENARDVVNDHVGTLLSQLERIIADGIAAGEFPRKLKARTAARAFSQATYAFLHPALILQQPATTDAEARAVVALLLAGFRAGAV